MSSLLKTPGSFTTGALPCQFCDKIWETDFYTPPVLGGAALLPFSAPAVYKNPVP